MPELNDAPDPDATVPMTGPVPRAASMSRSTGNLPLPGELAKLLPEGNYDVEDFLGQGGMGAVYKATQVRLQRKVAIKIMRRDEGRDYDFEERFRREALAMAQLNHPNIVNVIDYGEAGPDYLYIVMEFVDGTDLVGVIRSGQMTQEMALKLLPQICDALQFAHDNGIVHRDIKPANILLTRDGRIKMADFGLAKRLDVNSYFQTQTGAGMGTPDYAAPEQFDPQGNVDHRADIYSLGVMIYQMVTGQLPRGAWKLPTEKMDVDAQWDKIVSQALQSDPCDRYASVSEIKMDISTITLPTSGQGGVTGTAVSRTRGFTGKLGVSKTLLTQAGGRSAAAVQAPAPPRSNRRLVYGLAGALVIAAGAYFAWDKFAAEVPPISVTNQAPSAAPTLPAPIRLWDAADKIPKEPRVSWVDDTLRLDNVEVAHVFSVAQRVVVKTSIRFNPDTEGVKLGLRQRSLDEGAYFLNVNFANDQLALIMEGQDEIRYLKIWKMPRHYRPGEWLPVELRVVDGEISVSLEGTLLGTVHDSALSDFTAFTLSSIPYAHFRDIEVLPLDPSWTNQPPAPSIPVIETMAETVQRPVPKPAAWVDATVQVRDDVVQAGAGAVQGDWLVLSKTYFTRMPDRKILRNAVVRMSFKGAAGMALRTSPTDFSYQCVLNTNRTLGLFSFDGLALTRVHFNKLVKLEPDFDLLAEHELVMAVEEDLISVWLDGRLMLSQRDSNLAQGRITVMFQAAGSDASLHPHVKKVEYADLGDTPAATAAPALPSSTIATKDAPFENSLGMKFVPVPGTDVLFCIHEVRYKDYEEYAKMAKETVEGSWKTQTSDGFEIKNDAANHPVTRVNWDDAQKFCAWLSEKEGKTYRLPTDQEWSHAVGIGREEDWKDDTTPATVIQVPDVFPWGDGWPPPAGVGNYSDESRRAKAPRDDTQYLEGGYDDAFPTTAPVMRFAANKLGLFDLGGNVWEWCEDWYSVDQKERVLRGCSWGYGERGYLLSSGRYLGEPHIRYNTHGFRVVLAVSSGG